MAGNPATAPQVPPAGTPPAQTPAPGGQPATPPANTLKEPEKKTLTQAEIDSIVEERLKRDRESREQRLASELGMSIKDVKALIKTKKDADEAAKTAFDREKERADNAERQIKLRDLKDSKRSSIEKLIADKKIKLPDHITLTDAIDLVTGEDDEAVNKSLERLLKLFPYSAPGMPAANPANPAGGNPPNLDEQIQAAHAEGLKTGNWNQYTQLCMEKQNAKKG